MRADQPGRSPRDRRRFSTLYYCVIFIAVVVAIYAAHDVWTWISTELAVADCHAQGLNAYKDLWGNVSCRP